MATIVIGGHARNVGKTSIVTAILSAWPERRWSAVKISSHWHETPTNTGIEDVCRIDEELQGGTRTDTGRYVAAGAARSFWIRIRTGCLEEAIPRLMPALNSNPDVIIESNRIVRFVQPDLFLMIVRCGLEDFKESARKTLPLAHAVLYVGSDDSALARDNIPTQLASDIPVFPVPDPQRLTPELTAFIETHLGFNQH